MNSSSRMLIDPMMAAAAASSGCPSTVRIAASVFYKAWQQQQQPAAGAAGLIRHCKSSCSCGDSLHNFLFPKPSRITALVVVSENCLPRSSSSLRFSCSSSDSSGNRCLHVNSSRGGGRSSSSHLQQFNFKDDVRKRNSRRLKRCSSSPSAIRCERSLSDQATSFDSEGVTPREIFHDNNSIAAAAARATTVVSVAETLATPTSEQPIFFVPSPHLGPSVDDLPPHQLPSEEEAEEEEPQAAPAAKEVAANPESSKPTAKPFLQRNSERYVESPSEKEAWALLKDAVVTYCGDPVGTIAARDPSDPYPQNYDQVFLRDFIPSAIAFLIKGEHEIVRNFLIHTLQLQSWEKTVDCYSPGQGLMPASFKVLTVFRDGNEANGTEEILDPDFGEAAIGRVAPVDSGLWWIILLRAYAKCTGDTSLQERVDFQTGIKMILKVCLADGFDMFPTLLVTDGSCMIDRRMGIHGHPLEIQALFYQALRFARDMLVQEDGVAQDLKKLINSRLSALLFHIQEYYWLDLRKLNEIYRYKTEEYSYDAVNKFNIYPDQVSPWLFEWIPNKGGYFIGNLQPAHMDFRFFSLGNLWSICGSLATKTQAEDILELMEAKWDDLIGTMPLKICFPALAEDEWRIITGSDPKNTAWSYHNGGSWPTLMWQFSVACIKMGRRDLAQRAVEVAEKRLSRDRWPEYYDTRSGRFVGKQARLFQTWSIAGFLVAKLLLRHPEAASWLTCDEESNSVISCGLDMNPRRRRKFNPLSNSNLV